jgi:hypothetical protein
MARPCGDECGQAAKGSGKEETGRGRYQTLAELMPFLTGARAVRSAKR